MFRGKAELQHPKTDARVGAFTETCEDDGTSHARVVLEPPVQVTGTASLAISGGSGGVIAVGAKNGGPTEIHEFGGMSQVGCLPNGSEVSLVKNLNGNLSTLDIVVARGIIREEH